MASGEAEDSGEEADEVVGVCGHCGNLGVLLEIEGRVLCQSCYDLIADYEPE